MSALDSHRVDVTLHCQIRWNERVGSGAGPEADVRAALAAGRVSPDPPDGIWLGAPLKAATLYAWNENRDVAYAVEATDDRWVVRTVVTTAPRTVQQAAPAPLERRLTTDVAKLERAAPEPLHLPPAPGHDPRVDSCRGVWTVTCSCAGHRVRSADRHDQEAAWGRHRNGLD